MPETAGECLSWMVMGGTDLTGALSQKAVHSGCMHAATRGARSEDRPVTATTATIAATSAIAATTPGVFLAATVVVGAQFRSTHVDDAAVGVFCVLNLLEIDKRSTKFPFLRQKLDLYYLAKPRVVRETGYALLV